MKRSLFSDSSRQPENEAHFAAPSPQNTAGGSGRYLHRTVPSRQQSARAFLQGEVPGVQQSYAPNARPSETEGWVEDDETVERLARWREEAPYG